MAETRKSAATVGSLAEKVTPPLTEQEQDRAEELVAQGLDPVDACEQVLDERVGNNARAIRERDGDPYPPLDSFLPEGERKKRAQGRVDREFGGTPDTSEVEALRAEVAELRSLDLGGGTTLAAYRETAAELDRLRAQVGEQLLPDPGHAPEDPTQGGEKP